MIDKGHSLPEVRQLNRARIREAIFKMAPVTRIEVAEVLGLTLPTITTSVVEMLRDGLLRELPVSGEGVAGRKPQAIEFREDAACALGVELGPYNTAVCGIDARGGKLFQQILPVAPPEYAAMTEWLTSVIEAARMQLAAWGAPFLGVGVGLPGFIKGAQGVIRSNPRPDWNGKTLAQDLSDRLLTPVLIDNNVRVRAIGEELFARRWHPDLFAYFFISKGIACPLMIKTDVIAGYTAGAGEIGHIHINKGGPVCPVCGNAGCLDSLAGEDAILRACRLACEQERAPLLRQLYGQPPYEALDMKTVLQAQELGDPDVCAILDQAVEYLGSTVATMANLISPELVVVDGYIMKSESNRQKLVETAQTYLYGLNSEEVQFRFLPFDQLRGAHGAAAKVLRALLLQA